MLEVFIFETGQLLENIEEIMLSSEKAGELSAENVNEIFRAMHTIKGSAAMMSYDGILGLAHAVEDLFHIARERGGAQACYSDMCDIVLQASDFMRGEVAKISGGAQPDGDPCELCGRIRGFVEELKAGETETRQGPPAPAEPSESAVRSYSAHVTFEENCQMENVRAFSLVHQLKDHCLEVNHRPADLFDDEAASEEIARNGFFLTFTSGRGGAAFEQLIGGTMFVKAFTLDVLPDAEPAEHEAASIAAPPAPHAPGEENYAPEKQGEPPRAAGQGQISVNVEKLDKLMDLVGEMVIAEAMVTRSPDLEGLRLEGFDKAARHMRKLTGELRDVVMSVRMVPVAGLFRKMTRIVRDMGRKLDKDAGLTILGGDTELDKSIIDSLSDPLMHIIRNAMDHGLEQRAERKALGKLEEGRITLTAVNTGGEVLITVSDDGRGLDREKILRRARSNNLLPAPESELTDREIYSLVLLPGFSTKDEITEYSGRGVGMDVVRKNIEQAGGSVFIESVRGFGTTVTIRIPLTLAIVDGMTFAVGRSAFTLPAGAIREVFRPGARDVFTDDAGREMLLARGRCLPVIRLQSAYGLDAGATDFGQGVMLEVEAGGAAACLFADRLIGTHQAVVKPLPRYFERFGVKRSAGIGGCTILGDGSVSLILDVAEVVRCFV